MTNSTALRVGLAILICVLGSVQAWDSNVPAAGLPIVFLVSPAIALPTVALLVPLKQNYYIGAITLSFILMLLARVISPIPSPGLFLALVPAMMGLIFSGMVKQGS